MKPESPPRVALVYGQQLHRGGVETHLRSLIRRRAAPGQTWHVVADASPDFICATAPLGACITRWSPRHGADPFALARLMHILSEQQISLVHVHSGRGTLLGCTAGRALGLPVVLTVHLPSHYYVAGPSLLSRLKRRAYRAASRLAEYDLADRIVHVSSRIREESHADGGAPRSRSRLIPNGLESPATPRLPPLRRADLDLNHAAHVIGFVGRLDRQKGVDILLDALLHLPDGTCLWIAGDGPSRAALTSQVERLGLRSRVRFLGFRDDIARLLPTCDLFALPSRYEASPFALLEALASGRPCVVTDVGDNAELVDRGRAGWVVPPENPHALAKAIHGLLEQPVLRCLLGDAARRLSYAYRADRMAESTFSVYTELLQRSGQTVEPRG